MWDSSHSNVEAGFSIGTVEPLKANEIFQHRGNPLLSDDKGLYTKEEGMQLPMVAIQTAKCKSLLKIATFSISAWAGEDWTFVALWFCVVVKSSGVLGECYLA